MRRLTLAAIAFACLCSGQALAQASATTPALKTRVITLGTQGGPLQTKQRAQPANAVVVGDSIYLVDAGNGVMRQLVLAGLDILKVDQIFITHNHDDHNADWGAVMAYEYMLRRSIPVTVHGPLGTESMLQGYLQYYATNAALREADAPYTLKPADVMKAQDVKSGGLVYQDKNVKVSATENCHFNFDPASKSRPEQKSFAYRFETADKVIVFSGDTGYCTKLADFARGADILVHEVISLPLVEVKMRGLVATMPPADGQKLLDRLMRHMRDDHTTPEDVGKLATAAGVKKVVLSHFTPGNDNEPENAYTDGVKKFFSGPVLAARDLMEF